MQNLIHRNNIKSKILWLSFIVVFSFLLSAYKIIQPPSPIKPKTIFISSPSTGSSLFSPISLQAEIICQPDSFIRIELTDSKMNLLYRQLIKTDCGPSQSINLNELIYFATNNQNTLARLTISLIDNSSKYLSVSSVELKLSTESQVILVNLVNQTDFLVINPLENSLTQGGSLLVSGWINPANSSPVILELTLESGEIIGSRQILIQDEQITDYQYFDIDIPYNIPGIQSAMLTIRQVGEKIPGNVSLERLPIQLGP